jgi:hypothetical protein
MLKSDHPMSKPPTCLAIAIPPPEAETALTQTLRRLFPTLEAEMLAPYFESGETLYLSSADRPVLQHVAQTLRATGLQVDACQAPTDLHTERSLVMPHPESGADTDRRTVIALGRRRQTAEPGVAIIVPFQDVDTPDRSSEPPCQRCREPLIPTLGFCAACGHELPAEAPMLHRLEILLPDDGRRHRILGWLAQATGRSIPQLRPGTGNRLQAHVTVPPDVASGLIRHLAGWGAVVTAESGSDVSTSPVQLGPRDAGIGLAVLMMAGLTALPQTMGTGFWALALGGWALTHRKAWRQWRSGGLPAIAPEAAVRLAGPLPADLLADLRACLAETTGSSLQPAVRRTLSATAGLFGAMGASDAVSQHLWQDLEPQIRAVVSGILGLVRRGRQLEHYLSDHPGTAVEHEVRRLERLIERTSDPVSRGHYDQALTSARQTRQRRQDALIAAERLGSQLLVLLHGLADVQATVAMSGLGQSRGDSTSLITQLQRLQRDARAADDALQELLS